MDPHDTDVAWPSKAQDKKSRNHNHHISLRERIKEYQSRTQEKHPKSQGNAHATTKAAAWAVFQHHGRGGVGLSQTHGSAVRCSTRFKIEAQMKHEIARPSMSKSVTTSWDAESTLFDSFELDSLLKTLDQAANAASVSQQSEGAGAMVVYSKQHWLSRPDPNPPRQRHNHKLQGQRSFPARGAVDDERLDTVDETRPSNTSDNDGERPASYKIVENLIVDDLFKKALKDAESDPFANFGHTPSPFNVRRNARRSFDSLLQEKSGKGGARDLNHRSKWKSLLHTLHLDSASGLFNSQVAPHDSQKKLEEKATRARAKAEATTDVTTRRQKQSIIGGPIDAYFDPRFDPKNLHISMDVHPPALESPPAPSWKLGTLKSMLSRPFSR